MTRLILKRGMAEGSAVKREAEEERGQPISSLRQIASVRLRLPKKGAARRSAPNVPA
jgi:hypothetical protein